MLFVLNNGKEDYPLLSLSFTLPIFEHSSQSYWLKEDYQFQVLLNGLLKDPPFSFSEEERSIIHYRVNGRKEACLVVTKGVPTI